MEDNTSKRSSAHVGLPVELTKNRDGNNLRATDQKDSIKKLRYEQG